MKKLLLIQFGLACTLMLSNTSYAKQSCSGKTIFSCQTKSKKTIKVCQVGSSLVYSYGFANKPEIKIKHDVDDVIKSPWNGVGSSYNYSVGFKNGSTTYEVYGAHERKVKGKYSAGVLVNTKNKDFNVSCDSNKNIIDYIDDFLNSK